MPEGRRIEEKRDEARFPMPLIYRLVPVIVALVIGVLLVWGELWLI